MAQEKVEICGEYSKAPILKEEGEGSFGCTWIKSREIHRQKKSILKEI